MGQPIGTPLDADALARREEQVKEYTTWVAATDIFVGTAKAYNAGDPVPMSNVERHRYDRAGLVVKRDSAEGKRLVGERGAGDVDATDAAIVGAHARDVVAQAMTPEKVESNTSKADAKGGSK